MFRGDNKIMGFVLRSVQDLILQTIAGFLRVLLRLPERGLRPRSADCGPGARIAAPRIFRSQGDSLITAIWRVHVRVMIRYRRSFMITEYDAEGHPHRSLRDLAAVHDHGK
jgi:hypothetical protein